MYIFRDRGVLIDVYKADDKIVTSGATLLADISLRRTYRAIDSVATGEYLLYSVVLGIRSENAKIRYSPCFSVVVLLVHVNPDGFRLAYN